MRTIVSLSGNLRKKGITMHQDGLIEISAHASKLLRLQKGDSIDIATDGEEFWLYVAHKASSIRFGSAVSPSSKRGHSMRCNNRAITRTMLKGKKKKSFFLGALEQHPSLGPALPIITAL